MRQGELGDMGERSRSTAGTKGYEGCCQAEASRLGCIISDRGPRGQVVRRGKRRSGADISTSTHAGKRKDKEKRSLDVTFSHREVATGDERRQGQSDRVRERRRRVGSKAARTLRGVGTSKQAETPLTPQVLQRRLRQLQLAGEAKPRDARKGCRLGVARQEKMGVHASGGLARSPARPTPPDAAGWIAGKGEGEGKGRGSGRVSRRSYETRRAGQHSALTFVCKERDLGKKTLSVTTPSASRFNRPAD